MQDAFFKNKNCASKLGLFWDMALVISLEAIRGSRGGSWGGRTSSCNSTASGEVLVGSPHRAKLLSSGKRKEAVSMEHSGEYGVKILRLIHPNVPNPDLKFPLYSHQDLDLEAMNLYSIFFATLYSYNLMLGLIFIKVCPTAEGDEDPFKSFHTGPLTFTVCFIMIVSWPRLVIFFIASFSKWQKPDNLQTFMIIIVLMLFECYNYHITTCFIRDILDNRDATACQGLSPAILPPEMGTVLPCDW